MSGISSFGLRDRSFGRGSARCILSRGRWPGDMNEQTVLRAQLRLGGRSYDPVTKDCVTFFFEKGALILNGGQGEDERRIINRFFSLVELPYELQNIRGSIRLKNNFTGSYKPYEDNLELGLSGTQYRRMIFRSVSNDMDLIRYMNRISA